MSTHYIFAAGGLALEVYHWFRDQIDIVAFIDRESDSAPYVASTGLPVIAEDALETVASDNTYAIIAAGDPALRQKLAARAASFGFQLATLKHASAVIADTARLGDACIIAPNVSISPDVELGQNCYINMNAAIGHGASLGENCVVSPGAVIAGDVQAEDNVSFGASSVVNQGLRIASGTKLASGAIVFSHCRTAGTYMGNPAKRMRILT